MTSTVYTGTMALTANINPSSSDILIFAPGSIVTSLVGNSLFSATSAVGVSLTMAGFADFLYVWVNGNDTINITSTGTFVAQSVDTDIAAINLGFDYSNNHGNGGSTLNNSGEIDSARDGVWMRGFSDAVNNFGTIAGRGTGVVMGADRHNNGTHFTNDLLFNSGIISGVFGFGVEMQGSFEVLNNFGTISSASTSSAVAVEADFEHIANSATITNSVAETGAIYIDVFSMSQFDLSNSGTISSQASHGFFSANTSAAQLNLTNSGTISGGLGSISTLDTIDHIINTGTLNGDVTLGAGADTFDNRGGVLNGTVSGGLGNDVYYIDRANVVIVEDATAGEIDTVFAATSYRMAANVEVLTLLEGGDYRGIGNASGNTITGNSGDNRLVGLAGNDTMTGDLGNDSLFGGLGNDSLTGGDGEDLLQGGAGNDVLNGGDGDDILIGGAGKDALTGGTGADVFVFSALSQSANTHANADVITGFAQGEDLINLSAIDANAGNAASNDAFTFIGAAAFSHVAGQAHYVQTATDTYFEVDVNGDAVSDMTIRLVGLIALNASDFVL